MSSRLPDIAFTQNAAHMIPKNLSIGASGMRRAKPRIRRSIAALRPTRNPRPTVCMNRIVGYAQSELDSRTQMLNRVFSTDARKCIIGR